MDRLKKRRRLPRPLLSQSKCYAKRPNARKTMIYL